MQHQQKNPKRCPMQHQQILSQLKTAAPILAGNLSAIPLFGDEPAHTPEYALLDEALADGSVEITEVSEGGSVPELFLKNHGIKPVLLLDGDQLIGAKQNRVINLTILIGAKTETLIPVSCVEQGRWSYRSRHFTGSNRKMAARMRRSKMEDVSYSLRSQGSRRSNQARVWEEVAVMSQRTGVESETGAMEDIYEGAKGRYSPITDSLKLPEGALGAIFCIDGKPVGIEVYDRPETLKKVEHRLVESYAVDAIYSESPNNQAPAEEIVVAFLARVMNTPCESFKALGIGEDLRLESADIVGGALTVEEGVVHLSAFERETQL